MKPFLDKQEAYIDQVIYKNVKAFEEAFDLS